MIGVSNMPVKKLLKITVSDNHTLLLTYADNDCRIFDVRPYISGSWYGELENPEYFRHIRIVCNTVEWPDGQDIAPHELYEESIPI